MQFGKFRWAGIGTRSATRRSSLLFMQYSCCMTFYGGIVESGAADGIDTAVEVGAKIAYDCLASMIPGLTPGEYSKVMSIHLPSPSFNGRQANPFSGYYYVEPTESSKRIAKQFHPAFERLRDHEKKLMYRNGNQILGLDLQQPVKFVACETPDGVFTKDTTWKTGGTGQAIRIADYYGIKVYNSRHPEHRVLMESWIKEADRNIQVKLGVSPIALVDDFLSRFHGIENRTEGDLVAMANKGEVDVLMHGCNVLHYNSGIAKAIRQNIPEAYDSFLRTPKGDKKKLGTIDCVTVKRNKKEFTVVNAFVQAQYGHDEDTLYIDYKALRKCLDEVAKKFDKSKVIGIPRIGAGLGNGCWVTLSNIINQKLKGYNVVLVDLPADKPVPDIKPEEPTSQLGLSF